VSLTTATRRYHKDQLDYLRHQSITHSIAIITNTHDNTDKPMITNARIPTGYFSDGGQSITPQSFQLTQQ
jgi:hypothetical protein